MQVRGRDMHPIAGSARVRGLLGIRALKAEPAKWPWAEVGRASIVAACDPPSLLSSHP